MSAHEPEPANWHYLSANNERLGPVSIRELSFLAGEGKVRPETLVWSPGYSDWIRAEEIRDLMLAARTSPPPLAANGNGHAMADGAAPSVAAPVARVEQAEAVTADGDDAEQPVAAVASTSPGEAMSTIPREIQPRKGSFVFPRIVGRVIASAVFGVVCALLLGALGYPPWPGLAVFLVGSVVGTYAAFVSYRKERYQIQDSRVLCHRGGLVSDQTTELEVRNITHVKLKLPWLRYKLFGIGHVMIETAGNAQPVVMQAIREPEAIYAGMRELMRSQGYDLTQRELLHEEKPAIIGVLGECLGLVFGAGMAVLFFLPGLAEAPSELSDAVPESFQQGVVAVTVFGLLVTAVLRFLDYRRRTYRVYNDVVVYEEGFLTRENAFIPYENIADSNTKCSLFDQILGLYDVQVSCQGSSSEIKFRRLRHGVALSAAIDRLVIDARGKPKLQPKSKSASPVAVGDTAAASGLRPRRSEPAAVPLEQAMVAELKMDATRTLVPLLFLLPLVPLWVAAMIQALIRLSSTHYSVRPGSLRHSYRFLSVHDREFAYDKITGLVIKRNLWDRWFGTITLKFWSIGSGQALEFANVRASLLDLPALMRQAGIPDASPSPYEAKASFGVLTWLRARINFLPLLLVFVAGTVYAAIEVDPLIYDLLVIPVVVAAGACLYARIYYARQRLRFHEHHIEAEQGIIVTRRYYARYGNVKRTRVTSYPGGREGELQIFVAGEEELQTAKQQTQQQGQHRILKPCAFTSGFLPAVREQGMLLDDILSGRVDPDPQAVAAEPLPVLIEGPRSVASAVMKLVLLSVILVPLVVLLPITLPLTVVRVKRWRYRVDAARIVVSWGIFYRSEMSVLLDRVDSLQQSQGPLNKMFRNGNVTIMTAGSSKPDLRLVDSPAYHAIYEFIRDHSQ